MNILPQIEERVRTRRARWQTQEEDVLPHPRLLNETSIIGGFSISALTSRRRFLLTDVLITTEGGRDTPSAIARDYLILVYKKSPPVKHTQVTDLKAGLKPMPAYAAPGKWEAGYYIDIEAAYWSIMLKVGWNVDYWPRKWLGSGRPPSDFPFPKNKIARNCLVSAGIVNTCQLWTVENGVINVSRGNHLANLQLYRLINDVLRSIAQEAKRAGAVYIATDGYIAPDAKTLAAIYQIIKDWGLTPRIKAQGLTEVWGAGSYRVGLARTKRKVNPPAPLDNVNPVLYSQWLKDRFPKFEASL